MRIAKPHTSFKVLEILFGKPVSPELIWKINNEINYDCWFHGYIGITRSTRKQCQSIFLNNRSVQCPIILHWTNRFLTETFLSLNTIYQVKNLNDHSIFILLYIFCPASEYVILKDDVYFLNIHNLIQAIRKSIDDAFFKKLLLMQKQFRQPVQPKDPSFVMNRVLMMRRILLTMHKPIFNLKSVNFRAVIARRTNIAAIRNSKINIDRIKRFKIKLVQTAFRIAYKVRINKLFNEHQHSKNFKQQFHQNNIVTYDFLDENSIQNHFQVCRQYCSIFFTTSQKIDYEKLTS
ncbi:uncharacterized protein [Prorops nasuta]|uniref:uncharacterized protein n=1 Tax=Prorops nasuta TaxID=863751 RepID=UPI0034CDECB8